MRNHGGKTLTSEELLSTLDSGGINSPDDKLVSTKYTNVNINSGDSLSLADLNSEVSLGIKEQLPSPMDFADELLKGSSLELSDNVFNPSDSLNEGLNGINTRSFVENNKNSGGKKAVFSVS